MLPHMHSMWEELGGHTASLFLHRPAAARPAAATAAARAFFVAPASMLPTGAAGAAGAAAGAAGAASDAEGAADAAGAPGADASGRSPPPPLPRATQEPKAAAPLHVEVTLPPLVLLYEQRFVQELIRFFSVLTSTLPLQPYAGFSSVDAWDERPPRLLHASSPSGSSSNLHANAAPGSGGGAAADGVGMGASDDEGGGGVCGGGGGGLPRPPCFLGLLAGADSDSGREDEPAREMPPAPAAEPDGVLVTSGGGGGGGSSGSGFRLTVSLASLEAYVTPARARPLTTPTPAPQSRRTTTEVAPFSPPATPAEHKPSWELLPPRVSPPVMLRAPALCLVAGRTSLTVAPKAAQPLRLQVCSMQLGICTHAPRGDNQRADGCAGDSAADGGGFGAMLHVLRLTPPPRPARKAAPAPDCARAGQTAAAPSSSAAAPSYAAAAASATPGSSGEPGAEPQPWPCGVVSAVSNCLTLEVHKPSASRLRIS